MNRLAWFVGLWFLTNGCDGTVRDREPGTVDGGQARLDAARYDTNVDGRVLLDADVIDAGLDSGGPDQGRTVSAENLCDGLDDDSDGFVDEGATNACGGCGGLPPGGCQLWSINLTQTADKNLNTGRLVGLAARIVGVSFVEVPNGTCRLTRLTLTESADENLGVISVINQDQTLVLRPNFDPNSERVFYAPDDEMAVTIEFEADSDIQVNATGGQRIPAFEDEVTMPHAIQLESDESLDAIADFMTNTEMEPPTIRWQRRDTSDSRLRLYVGGSKVVFRRVAFYQAIEHLVLDAAVVDDGELTLPQGVSGQGLEGSSLWVYLLRQMNRRLTFGPHAVLLSAGQRIETRKAGGTDLRERPPFQIVSPNPNTREVDTSQPLPIRWTELPDGPGPLQMSLSYRDTELGQQTLVECDVIDPSLGEFILPEEMAADIPTEPGQFRQVTLRWITAEQALPAPDQGRLSKAVSVFLNFTQ
ncbi:MAG: hypothetical protein CMH52_03835 [Myxococcales bacterium]|nr:hypothetical protein [Myxococcales bacterium]